MMHYVIGDVHGEFDTLLALVAKLPKDAKLIFVGDLIDRGEKSKEVIEFVRQNNHLCVLGNHEELMLTYGESFAKRYPNSTNISFLHSWYNNGGIATLKSYNLLKQSDTLECVENQEGFEAFLRDLEWLKTLPLYIELPCKINNLPVVVSHASCGDVWHHHNNPSAIETFKEFALWERTPPKKTSPIFNIFGHTPTPFGAKIEEHYANIDTGCYVKKDGYGMLSAFCVEMQEVVSVQRRE